LDGPFFHVGRLMIDDPGAHSLEFCIQRSGFERCFDDTSGRIQSVVVRGAGEGRYSFPGWVDGIGGNFASSDGRIHFTADQNCSFVDILVLRIPFTSPFDGTGVFGFSLAPDPSQALFSMVIEASKDICDSLYPISSLFARSAEWGSSVTGQRGSDDLDLSCSGYVSRLSGSGLWGSVWKERSLSLLDSKAVHGVKEYSKGMETDGEVSALLFDSSVREASVVILDSNVIGGWGSGSFPVSLGHDFSQAQGSMRSQMHMVLLTFREPGGIPSSAHSQSSDEGKGSKTVWIVVGSILALILVVVLMIVAYCCTRSEY
jgi:hypothetical protein